MISHQRVKLALIFILLLSFSHAFARSGCETYSHIELKEKYQANFLNKDYQGCFSYSVDPSNAKAPEASFVIRLGDHLTHLNTGTTAKIAHEAFTSFVNSNRMNKALSDDVEKNLNSIRYEAKLAAQKIDNDLLEFNEVYRNDAIEQLRQNKIDIKNDTDALVKKIDILDQKMASLSAKSTEILFPPTPSEQISKKLGPIEKEKQKWDSLKNKNAIPFRSLQKITQGNNKKLSSQLLKEIKAERYNQLGLTKIETLPTLRQVQKYEGQENRYNQKLDIVNNGPELTRAYSHSELQTIKNIAAELKKEADKNLIEGKLDEANDSIDMAYLSLDIATSLPIIASGRGIYELYTGKSLIDGHELTKLEKAMAGGMILLDLTPASVIARGVGLVGSLSKAGTRLVERGIIKAGFEESLNLSAKYADAFATSANQLINQGVVKYDTIKSVIEHKLFFKFIEEEAYFSSKAYADKLIRFEAISSLLTKEGIEASPNLNQYLSNVIQFETTARSNESLLRTSELYLHYESKFKSIAQTSVDDLIVTRVSEKPYSPFDTSKGWYNRNISTGHRLSMEGESALYTVIGNNENSLNAALSEINASKNMLDEVLIESKSFSSKKVLDLTDPKNLEILEISTSTLKDNDYTLTQILGHLAKMNQFDAIISPGAKTNIYGTLESLEYYTNYIILRGF